MNIPQIFNLDIVFLTHHITFIMKIFGNDISCVGRPSSNSCGIGSLVQCRCPISVIGDSVHHDDFLYSVGVFGLE
uniref:Uncharacterized protein n=1 Tax=Rhizophora mucronata TaxID=61149 RepID=A0A2P2N542_RHIMU